MKIYLTAGLLISGILVIGCKKKLPTVLVSTLPLTSITNFSVISGVEVHSNKQDAVKACGLCWDKNPAPTFQNAHTQEGSGLGTYQGNISGLQPNTRYYVRAYATRSTGGIEYGEELSFTTPDVWSTTSYRSQGVISSMAVNESYIFIGNDYGVWRSADDGLTFVPINNGLSSLVQETVLNIFVIGSRTFVSTEKGLFISANNGESWALANYGLGSNWISKMAASGSNILAVTYSGDLFISVNGGSGWAPVKSTEFMPVLITGLATIDSTIFVGKQLSGIFASTNNGANWTALNQGLPDQPNIWGVFGNGTAIYACVWGDGVYRSADGGSHWVVANQGLTDLFVAAFIQNDRNLIVATQDGEMFLSTDGGSIWNPIMTGFPPNAVSGIFCTRGNYVYTTAQGAVYKRLFF